MRTAHREKFRLPLGLTRFLALRVVGLSGGAGRRIQSSSKFYPLLLVSDATEIEIAPNTSPVEVGGQGISFLGSLGEALIQAVIVEAVAGGPPADC